MGAMRITSIRIGLIVATLNVLVFIAILLTHETAYARLAELDACFRSGSSCDVSSAEPMYIAGSAFYSPAHYGDVPRTQTLFFMANMPPMSRSLPCCGRRPDVRYRLETGSLWWTSE